jgi:hypothetical protein
MKRTPDICPQCLEKVTEKEIKANRGMCEACREYFDEKDAYDDMLHRESLEYMCEEPEDYGE